MGMKLTADGVRRMKFTEDDWFSGLRDIVMNRIYEVARYSDTVYLFMGGNGELRMDVFDFDNLPESLIDNFNDALVVYGRMSPENKVLTTRKLLIGLEKAGFSVVKNVDSREFAISWGGEKVADGQAEIIDKKAVDRVIEFLNERNEMRLSWFMVGGGLAGDFSKDRRQEYNVLEQELFYNGLVKKFHLKAEHIHTTGFELSFGEWTMVINIPGKRLDEWNTFKIRVADVINLNEDEFYKKYSKLKQFRENKEGRD